MSMESSAPVEQSQALCWPTGRQELVFLVALLSRMLNTPVGRAGRFPGVATGVASCNVVVVTVDTD